MNPLAWWILDYASYDPSIRSDVDRRDTFRNGLVNVPVTNGKEYLQSISDDEVAADQLREQQQNGTDKLTLVFFINFDEQWFVSHFYDVDVESYTAESWTGVFDDPINYLPEHIKQILA